MKQKLRDFFKLPQAKLALGIVCVAAVLAVVFFLQPTPNQDMVTAAVSDLSAAENDSTVSELQDSISSELTSSNSSAEESEAVFPEGTDSSSSRTETSSGTSSKNNTSGSSTAQSGKDAYQTDPVPEGKPEPVELEDAEKDETKQYTCTISIRCDTILSHMDQFDQDKLSILPDSGTILSRSTVTFTEGESVFDVLKWVTRQKGIHLEYSSTAAYNSAYIEGIGNIYEFDCGSLSGWMYKVNGWFPNYGCSRYTLKQGDSIEWVYTCELGQDIGGGSSLGGS